jgi:aminoglycoside phosphotransferase (APT) family kinase protein
MELPAIEYLLGKRPDHVEAVLDYGYRAVWKVMADGQAFAVKCYESSELLERELQPHLHAGRAGVPVPEVVAEAREPVPTLVMRWVDGSSLGSCRSEKAWRDAGRILRLAHQEPVLQPRPDAWTDFLLSTLQDGLTYLVERRGLGPSDADRALGRAFALRSLVGARPLVWLHGDCQPDHFLVDPRTERVASVIDWADAREGDALMDLAVLTLHREDALPAVLDGYGADADLREATDSLLPLYRAVRAVDAARWLDEHGYPGQEWPLAAVRILASG